MFKFIQIPFGYVLEFFYGFFLNYGIALILFSLAVKVILLPLSMKQKKSMMKTSRLQPKVKQIELACGDDKQKYQQEVNQLYKDEGVSMMGGCLWSLLPLLILFPLYNVIREPLQYLLHLTDSQVESVKAAFAAAKDIDVKKVDAYWQYAAAADMATYGKGIVENVKSINFNFLGINLGEQPSWKFWTMRSWSEIGGLLIPIVSGGLNYLAMFISQKTNDTVITDDAGNKDAASATAQTGKAMTFMMPLVSVVFGYIMPLGLSIYWIAQSILGIVQDYFLTKHYRKIYDAEDEIKRQKAAALAEENAEKERIRAAKRAANPDGITENTSKKKQQLRDRQERDAAAKEYEAKKRAEKGEPLPEPRTNPGGEENRPYARGRAYVADRYDGESEE